MSERRGVGLAAVIPLPLRNAIRRGRSRIAWIRARLTRVAHYSLAENVYHCCGHKTASQWIRQILGDRRVYRYSGLLAYTYQTAELKGFDTRKITDRAFDHPFPTRTAVTPLYVDYANFTRIPKPGTYRAFFVARDPRDIVVSWYFSTKISHGLMGNVAAVRDALVRLPEEEGLAYTIRHLATFGAFTGLRSWADAPATDARVILMPFERLTGSESSTAFRQLFEHLDIQVPEDVLSALLDDYRFERLAGRARGQENQASHYRKGVAGDWRNHFTPAVQAVFTEVTGDLVERLGYA